MSKQKIYGYMRVSTKEQNEDRQRLALLEAGVAERMIYMDKQSCLSSPLTAWAGIIQS